MSKEPMEMVFGIEKGGLLILSLLLLGGHLFGPTFFMLYSFV